MLADGISVRAVQDIGGWTSLRMLERYTHPSDAETRRAVASASRLTRGGYKNRHSDDTSLAPQGPPRS